MTNITRIEATSIISRIERVIESCKTVEQIPMARRYLELASKRYPFILKVVTDMMCDRRKWVLCVAEEGKR